MSRTLVLGPGIASCHPLCHKVLARFNDTSYFGCTYSVLKRGRLHIGLRSPFANAGGPQLFLVMKFGRFHGGLLVAAQVETELMENKIKGGRRQATVMHAEKVSKWISGEGE